VLVGVGVGLGARGPPMTQRMRARRAAEEAAKKEEEERKKKAVDDEVKAKARHDNPFIPSLPLVNAVIENNIPLVKELIWAVAIDSRLEYVNSYDKDGQTALFHTMVCSFTRPSLLILTYLLLHCAMHATANTILPTSRTMNND
jgi:hypothetical protein